MSGFFRYSFLILTATFGLLAQQQQQIQIHHARQVEVLSTSLGYTGQRLTGDVRLQYQNLWLQADTVDYLPGNWLEARSRVRVIVNDTLQIYAHMIRYWFPPGNFLVARGTPLRLQTPTMEIQTYQVHWDRIQNRIYWDSASIFTLTGTYSILEGYYDVSSQTAHGGDVQGKTSTLRFCADSFHMSTARTFILQNFAGITPEGDTMIAQIAMRLPGGYRLIHGIVRSPHRNLQIHADTFLWHTPLPDSLRWWIASRGSARWMVHQDSIQWILRGTGVIHVQGLLTCSLMLHADSGRFLWIHLPVDGDTVRVEASRIRVKACQDTFLHVQFRDSVVGKYSGGILYTEWAEGEGPRPHLQWKFIPFQLELEAGWTLRADTGVWHPGKNALQTDTLIGWENVHLLPPKQMVFCEDSADTFQVEGWIRAGKFWFLRSSAGHPDTLRFSEGVRTFFPVSESTGKLQGIFQATSQYLEILLKGSVEQVQWIHNLPGEFLPCTLVKTAGTFPANQ